MLNTCASGANFATTQWTARVIRYPQRLGVKATRREAYRPCICSLDCCSIHRRIPLATEYAPGSDAWFVCHNMIIAWLARLDWEISFQFRGSGSSKPCSCHLDSCQKPVPPDKIRHDRTITTERKYSQIRRDILQSFHRRDW